MSILSAASYERYWRRLQDQQARGTGLALGRLLMWPLVPFFQGASLAKRAFFASSSLFRTRLPALTVSIGNVTMGGGGKTSMTRLVADLLAGELARTTTVLCRGYRSQNEAPVLVVSRQGNMLVSPGTCGDEAWLLARWLPHCSVVVGRRRAVTGRYAVEQLDSTALLLDDGLQYWRLERDVDIVMVNVVEGFGNGLPFPRGPLRESLRALRRAHCIAIQCPGDDHTEELARLEEIIVSYAPAVPIIHLYTEAGPARSWLAQSQTSSTPNDTVSTLDGLSVHAFCGLGSPQSFRTTLEAAGATVRALEVFPDHHVYTAEDIEGIRQRARAVDAIITTEKDEANLSDPGQGLPLLVLPIRPRLSDDHRNVLVRLLRKQGSR